MSGPAASSAATGLQRPSALPPVSDADLDRGARELIERCLAVTAADRVLVIADEPTRGLAERIVAAASRVAADSRLLIVPGLDDDYPAAFAAIAEAVTGERPSVTAFAARDGDDRLAWDERFWALLDGVGARHAQLTALDRPSLGIGLAADYREVARFSELVRGRLTGAATAEVRNALGTEIRFALDPARPWTAFTGLYHAPGEGGRLPQGEVFCSPTGADGVIAASVLGYPFNASTGLLAEPVRFEVRGGRLVGLEHPDAGLASRLREWFDRDEHAGRIGEFAVGTNRACTALSGNLLFDENVPGCHIAFGHPFGDYTGAHWHSEVHVDLVVERPTITVDGTPLLVDGRYPDPVPADWSPE